MSPREDSAVCVREQGPDFYDQSFLAHKHWRRHYTHSRYFAIWAMVADRIARESVASVLDIGCGPGQVASLLRDRGVRRYLGIDFSTERIRRAQQVCPEFRFVRANVLNSPLPRTHDYDAAICLQFLEHIERDLDVIRLLRPNTRFYASVPNFGLKQHVRRFASAAEVRDRYADCLTDFRVDEHRANARGAKYFLFEGITQADRS